jgi:hypothetical protein
VDEQGPVGLLKRGEEWLKGHEVLRPAQPGGGDLQPRCTAFEQRAELAARGDAVAQGCLPGQCPPPAEARTGSDYVLQSRDALVVGVQQRLALCEWQVLHAERRGMAEHRCHPLVPQPPGPDAGVVVGGLEVDGGFAGQVQGPPVEARWLPSRPQRVQERLRPQMLMDVEYRVVECLVDRGPSVRARVRAQEIIAVRSVS